MKRDMDLVRDLLIRIEEADKPLQLDDFYVYDDFSGAEIQYHLKLLAGAGYIDASFRYSDNKLYYGSVSGLTWDGQDFLDVARSDKVWTRSKKAIKKAVGSTSFSVIKSVCVAVAEKCVISTLGE